MLPNDAPMLHDSLPRAQITASASWSRMQTGLNLPSAQRCGLLPTCYPALVCQGATSERPISGSESEKYKEDLPK